MAVGVEVNATHHRPVGSGYVTAVATVAHAGRTLVTCDVVVTDERDRRVCTARVTSMLRDQGAAPAHETRHHETRHHEARDGEVVAVVDVAAVVEALAARGAAEIPHPGGTLLAHLDRVHAMLTGWGARPALRLAGLCHAFYGTDGFPTAVGAVARRAELVTLVGEEAERLVYFYAACDREFSHARLADRAGAYRDRFTGAVSLPPLPLRRDFAELTVANELDVMRVNADLRARYGRSLRRLFAGWRDLLSDPAWQAVEADLPPPPEPGRPRREP